LGILKNAVGVIVMDVGGDVVGVVMMVMGDVVQSLARDISK
jgi:hypothetical protein